MTEAELHTYALQCFEGKLPPNYKFVMLGRPRFLTQPTKRVCLSVYVNRQDDAWTVHTLTETDHFPIKANQDYRQEIDILCQRMIHQIPSTQGSKNVL